MRARATLAHLPGVVRALLGLLRGLHGALLGLASALRGLARALHPESRPSPRRRDGVDCRVDSPRPQLTGCLRRDSRAERRDISHAAFDGISCRPVRVRSDNDISRTLQMHWTSMNPIETLASRQASALDLPRDDDVRTRSQTGAAAARRRGDPRRSGADVRGGGRAGEHERRRCGGRSRPRHRLPLLPEPAGPARRAGAGRGERRRRTAGLGQDRRGRPRRRASRARFAPWSTWGTPSCSWRASGCDPTRSGSSAGSSSRCASCSSAVRPRATSARDIASARLTESLIGLIVGVLTSTPPLGKEDIIATITGLFLDGARARGPRPV